ncbi:MAG TPA: hypothetical protein PLZ51_11945 [Aggregatilineales bacterium]|nr:hypothetical protein [Aggregatilineales bacterium]
MKSTHPSKDISSGIMVAVLDYIVKNGKCIIQKAGESPIEVSYNNEGWYEVIRDDVVIAKSVNTTFLASVLADLVCPMKVRHEMQWASALEQWEVRP